jgi:hypothetical protein
MLDTDSVNMLKRATTEDLSYLVNKYYLSLLDNIQCTNEVAG